MEPKINTPHIVGHIIKFCFIKIKEELPTVVDNLKVFEAKCSGHIMGNVPRDLKLPYSQIADLSGICFIDIHEIVSLVLSHNKLGTFGINDLASLVSLYLSNNGIDSISKEALSSFPSYSLSTSSGNRRRLHNSDLSDNLFLFVPGSVLKNEKDLSDLILSSNKFDKIESSWFYDMGRMLSNHLANGKLHTLGKQIRDL